MNSTVNHNFVIIVGTYEYYTQNVTQSERVHMLRGWLGIVVLSSRRLNLHSLNAIRSYLWGG